MFSTYSIKRVLNSQEPDFKGLNLSYRSVTYFSVYVDGWVKICLVNVSVSSCQCSNVLLIFQNVHLAVSSSVNILF